MNRIRRPLPRVALCVLILLASVVRAVPARAADDHGAVRIDVAEGVRGQMLVNDRLGVVTAVDGTGVVRRFSVRDGHEQASFRLPETWTASVVVDAGGAVLGARPDGAIELLTLADGATPQEVLPAVEGHAVRSARFSVSVRGSHVAVIRRLDVDVRALREGVPGARAHLLAVGADGRVSVLRELPEEFVHVGFGLDFEPGVVIVPGSGNGLLLRQTLGGESGVSISSDLVQPAMMGAPFGSSHDRLIAFHLPTFGVAVFDGTTGDLTALLDGHLDAGPLSSKTDPFGARDGWGAFVPRKAALAVVERGRAYVRIWDATLGTVIDEIPLASESVTGLSISPEGKLLVVGDESGLTVVPLDAAALPRLPPEPKPDELPPGVVAQLGASPWRTRGTVVALAVSPDGGAFATSDLSGNVVVRRSSDAATLWRARPGGGVVMRIVYSPDGAQIACARAESKAALLDARTGKLVDEIPHGGELGGTPERSSAVGYSPDGTFLAVGGVEGVVIWDVTKGEGVSFLPSPEVSLGGTPARLRAPLGFHFFTDHPLLMAEWPGGFSRGLDVRAGGQYRPDQKDHEEEPVLAHLVSADGLRWGAVYADGNVFVAGEARTVNGLACALPEPPPAGFLRADLPIPLPPVALRSGGEDVWWGEAGGEVVVARGPQAEFVHLPRVHTDDVTAVAISRDGRVAVTTAVDGSLCRWDAQSLEPGPQPTGAHGPATAVAYTGSDGSLAVGSRSDGVLLWPADAKEPAARLATDGEPVVELAASRGGRALAAACFKVGPLGELPETMLVVSWDLKSRKRRLQRELDVAGAAAVAVTDGGDLVALNTGSELRLVTSSGVRVFSPQVPDGAPRIGGVALDPAGRLVVASTADAVHVVDAKTAKLVRTLRPDAGIEAGGAARSSILSAAFAAEGKAVVAVLEDGSVMTWDVATGKVEGHGRPAAEHVVSAWFAASGDAALVSDRRCLILRKTSGESAHVASFVVPAEPWITGVAVHPGGAEIATAHADGTVVRRRR